MKREKSKQGYYGLVLISCCGLICVSLGIVVNSIGIFFGPMAETLGTGRGNIAVFSSIVNMITAVSGPALVFLEKKLSLRKIMLAGSVILFVGFMVLSCVDTLSRVYFAAPLVGLGAALLGTVPVFSLLNNWFEKKYGLVTGIAMSCGGLGGVILPPVFGKVIARSGWRASFLMMGVLALILTIPGTVFILRSSPGELGYAAYGSSEVPCGKEIKKRSKSWKELKSGAFICICILALTTASIHGLTAFLAEYGQQKNLTLTGGALLISFSMAGNICSKLLAGVLNDRIGAACTTELFCLMTVIGLVLLLAVSGKTPVFLYLGALLYGMSYAVNSLGVSQLSRKYFGKENYAAAYAFASPFCYLGIAVFTPVCGFIYDFTGGYQGAVVLAILLTATGALAVVRAEKAMINQKSVI